MSNNNFDLDFYLATLHTADAVGMNVVREVDLARVLAILHVAGNNEEMTHSYKFLGDVKFAQDKYHLRGGEIPDRAFCTLFNRYRRELEAYEQAHGDYPKWAYRIMKERYGIKLFVKDHATDR